MELKDFIHTALELHNKHRSDHGAPPLKIDEQLNRDAQSYAELEANANNQKHSLNPMCMDKYGENLANRATTDDLPRGADAASWAVGKWYDEVKFYDFNNPGDVNHEKWGHFSTMVWKGATRIGIGVAYGSKISPKTGNTLNTIFICARYLPACNNYLPEAMRENVLPHK